MCCFSAKTEVHGTSIFARFIKPGTQALVYQMQYTAKEPTAMILPLPVALPANDGSVRFKSLKDYASFFQDLARAFPAPQKLNLGLSRSKSGAVSAALPVHDVGDYVATFVPSAKDFSRVDARFVIAKDVWDRIPAYADYGFAVFQLKELSGSPHPIALDFDSRMPDTLFFPTVHIHDGSLHDKETFDHVLYAQERNFDERVGSYEGPENVDPKTGFVRSKEHVSSYADPAQAQGLLDGSLLVHKMTMVGELPNRDTMFDLRSILSRGNTGCGRCDAGAGGAAGLEGAWLPVSATVAGLGWIIGRRDLLGRRLRR